MRGPGDRDRNGPTYWDQNRFVKDKIKAIDKQMGTQRGNRGAMVRVALVGYTNVGNRH
jgi:GTP-binding protein HflX